MAPTPRRAVATEIVGAAGVALAFTLWDLVDALVRPPQAPVGALAVAALLCAGIGVGTLLFSSMSLVRFAVRAAVDRLGGSRALPGLLDGAALFVLAVSLQDPRALQGDLRGWGCVGALAAGGAASIAAERWPHARRPFVATLLVASVLGMTQLPWAGGNFVRLALHLAAAVAAIDLVRSALDRVRTRVVVAAGGTATLLLVVSWPLLGASEPGRVLVHQESTHARTWLQIFGAIGPPREDIRPLRSPPPVRRPRAPRSDRPDVLVLSIDSLRWDLVGDLPRLRSAIGAHATFTRAVSPSPHTAHSVASMLRGRPLRDIRLDSAPAHTDNPWRDTSPTLGSVLVRTGYRAISVRTDRYVDPSLGPTAGFETLWLTGRPAAAQRAFPGTHSMRAHEALALVEEAARATPGPLCVFLHLMDTHYPYRWGEGGSGPTDRAGQRRSVRDLDGRLARFLRDFVRVRGRTPVIVVAGDHGEAFGEHRATTHSSSVYAEQVRVVFLVADPGIGVGSHDAPVSTASIAPTVLDLVGVTPPASMTEPSLVDPLARGGSWPSVAVSEVRSAGWRAIGYTGPRYRLIVDPVHRTEQLFDTDRDPTERRDLSDDHPGLLREMQRLARAWEAGR